MGGYCEVWPVAPERAEGSLVPGMYPADAAEARELCLDTPKSAPGLLLKTWVGG